MSDVGFVPTLVPEPMRRSMISPTFRRHAAEALVALGVAGCGAGSQPPTDAEIRAAYAARVELGTPGADGRAAPLSPTVGRLVRLDPADCESDGDGHFNCPAVVRVEDGRHEAQMLVLGRAAGGWTVETVEEAE